MLVSEAVREDPNQRFIREYTVPFRIIRDKLMNIKNVDFESVSNILNQFHVINKITYEEDQKLKENGLNLEMPKDWDGKNPFVRYESVGILICQEPESS